MEKVNIVLEEYKKLRDDLSKTRDHLQRTFTNTIAFASIVTAFIGLSKFNNTNVEIVQTGLLIVTIVFIILNLNYVSNMRHYIRLSEYLALLGSYTRQQYQALGSITQITGEDPLLYWELFNAKKYNKPFSRFVFFISWGSQPVFPLFCAILAFSTSLLYSQNISISGESFIFKEWYDIFLFSIVILGLIFSIFSIFLSVHELFNFMGFSKNIKVKNKVL